MYLNSHIWLSFLAIEIFSFRKTFFPWNDLVNFRLNKCHSHTKISDFRIFLLALIKKVLMKNLKLPFFLTYVPVTLIKSKLQIYPVNPINPVLWNSQDVLINLSPYFTRSLKSKKNTQKSLLLWNLLGSSYKKTLMKNPKYVLETH